MYNLGFNFSIYYALRVKDLRVIITGVYHVQ
jgi:hypothetical protein